MCYKHFLNIAVCRKDYSQVVLVILYKLGSNLRDVPDGRLG